MLGRFLYCEFYVVYFILLIVIVRRLICGVAEGLILPAIQLYVSQWANAREKSFVLSMIFSGMNGGTIFAVSVTPWLIATFGWRGAMMAYSIFNLVWLSLFVYFMTSSPVDLGKRPFTSLLRLTEEELNWVPSRATAPKNNTVKFPVNYMRFFVVYLN